VRPARGFAVGTGTEQEAHVAILAGARRGGKLAQELLEFSRRARSRAFQVRRQLARAKEQSTGLQLHLVQDGDAMTKRAGSTRSGEFEIQVAAGADRRDGLGHFMKLEA
jgi:hypothetical protein